MSDEVVYVLMSDGDMTMHSSPEPIGIALRDEAEAREWARESGYRAVVAVRVFADREAAAAIVPHVRRRTRAEIETELEQLASDLDRRERLDRGEVIEAPIPPVRAWLEKRMKQVQGEVPR